MNRVEGLPCPICQRPMETGIVNASGRARLVWSKEPIDPLDGREATSKDRTERLTTTGRLATLFNDAVPAVRCPTCQVGAFDYGDA